MTHLEFAALVAGRLESLGLEYYITGSTASMLYGEVRFTQDVDIVVEIPAWKIKELCALFPDDGFYLSEEAAWQAVEMGGQFNIISKESTFKADIITFRDKPFDNSRLARRRRVEMAPGLSAYFASPEDVILKKLEYHRMGGSDKHLRDIAGIVKISGEKLDRRYLDDWALRIGVAAEWRTMKARVGWA